MTAAAIIVAAGRGTRAGGDIPKQWQSLGGPRLVDRAVAAFAGHPGIGPVILVHHPEDAALAATVAGCRAVPGGATRRLSVLAGLEAAVGLAPLVLIHDAARPLVSRGVIDRVLAALARAPAAAPGLPVVDALWRADGGRVIGTAARDGLWRAQTPQGFALPAILAAHRAHAGEAADDVAVALAAGIEVAIVEGCEDNLKITLPGDLDRAGRLTGQPMDIRTGTGFDVHRLGEGDHVWLCGVRIAHGQGLIGHSDADVGMHAITDAIYGALAAGDIGRHFPPSDPQWRGAASRIFLDHACGLARAAGLRLTHIDCTLICEAPKIAPHAAAMLAALAAITGLDVSRIGLKATTSEGLGFTGRGEGIAAMATATLVAP